MKRKVLFLFVLILLLSLAAACSKPVESLSAAELLDLGEKYLHEMNYEQALVQFTKIIEVEPMNIRAYLGGTDAYIHLDKIQDAVDFLTAGIPSADNENLPTVLSGIEKSVIEGYIALVGAYEAEGWHDKALELLQRVYGETDDEIIGRKLGIVDASTIAFREDYIISWNDAEFERLIRDYLGKPTGGIHYDDVKLIEKLDIWGEWIAKEGETFRASYSEESFWLSDGREGGKTGKIQTLSDLEHFSSLNDLSVNFQAGLSISALADTGAIDCLERLKGINLTADNISDISVVSGLIALERIGVSYNDITDISPISMLIELTRISVNNNELLASAEPLRGLRKLSSVSISNVNTVDMNVFVGLPELKSLNLVNIENADYSILTKLRLDYLEITCSDLTFQIVRQLNTLTNLRLHGQGSWDNEAQSETGGLTNITGIGALSRLTKLDLLAPNCHDISPLASLAIEELEIQLPEDCDLTPLTGLASLKTVFVNDNYRGPAGEGAGLFEKVKALLPHVEVTADRR